MNDDLAYILYIKSYFSKKRRKHLQEKIISQSFYSYLYAIEIIQGRWKEAENAIINNKIIYSINYISSLKKSRWPKLEKKVYRNFEHFASYLYYLLNNNLLNKRNKSAEFFLNIEPKGFPYYKEYLNFCLIFNHE